MKRALFTCFCVALLLPAFGQEALLSDILNVQPVEYSDEGDPEQMEEYNKIVEEERTKTDEELAKLDEDYKDTVAKEIEDFNKLLEEPDEQAVRNMKQSLVTKFRTFSMSLKKNKKDVVVQYKNLIVKEIRKLPSKIQIKKEKEIDEVRDEYFAKFEEEYKANMQVLDAFKKTEHLIKKPASAMSTEGSDG